MAHTISDDLFNEAQFELSRGNNWIAFQSQHYFLDKGDMFFFTYEDEARTFAADNTSDVDDFNVIQASSIISLLRQLPYGEDLQLHLSPTDLETLFQSFDWNEAQYDPLHDHIEASTAQEQDDLARMETLLAEWERLYDQQPEAALALAATYWEGQPMERYKDEFLTIKSELMNQENLSFLKDNIRNHGFGDTLNAQLEEQMKKGVAEFTLVHKTEVNKKEMEATLHFKKSDKSDFYFFNKYDAKCQTEHNKEMAQTFYLNNNWGVTLKEAYNLLNGRAVHKELTNKEDQKYKAWIQLDFSKKDAHGNYERKQYHENYGYDLKEALSYYPIKEMINAPDKDNLVRSLERGNLQMVMIETPGKDTKVFIEANPQFKSVQVYGNDMKRLGQEQREVLMKKPAVKEELGEGKEQGKDQKKEAKKTVKKDHDLDASKKKSRKKSMGI
jgi:hypothetical protein